MKLSISNIAWVSENDENVYEKMLEYGYTGLEIAPTRFISENPYLNTNILQAKKIVENIKKNYGFVIPSMQSIWFGRKEKMFGTKEERKILIDYTKNAIDYANAINCNNLVFGNPKNRNIENKNDIVNEIAYNFFSEIADYAKKKDVVVSIEPNPIIYGTNYINFTNEAFFLVKKINNPSFKVNIDLGTIIYNNEKIEIIKENLNFVNHVHISEPYLNKIENRKIHIDFSNMLKRNNYNKFISIEMKNLSDLNLIFETLKMVKEVFS